jgi:hypothetical protein
MPKTGTRIDAIYFERVQTKFKRNDEMMTFISRLIDKGDWNPEAQEHLCIARKHLDAVEWERGSEERCLKAMDQAFRELEFAVQAVRSDLYALVWDESGDAISIRRRVH